MKTREWDISVFDPLLKESFKTYCANKKIPIVTEGSVWLESGGSLAFYDWHFGTGIDFAYEEIINEYQKAKINAKLS